MSYLKSGPSNLSKYRVSCQKKKYRTKIALFGNFRAGIWKIYFHICYQQPASILLKCKVSCKTKNFEFETKNILLLGYFYTRIWKTIVIFEISIFKFVKMQSFMLEKRNFKFETKIVLSGNFWTGIWKNYCRIWNQHARICQNAKFYVKQKKL